MKPLFLQRKDGFYQWDIDDLVFLIGDTNESVAYVALWGLSFRQENRNAHGKNSEEEKAARDVRPCGGPGCGTGLG